MKRNKKAKAALSQEERDDLFRNSCIDELAHEHAQHWENNPVPWQMSCEEIDEVMENRLFNDSE